MKKSAFTLIELLVVIAIIAILAGIALPVFNKVLEKAHTTQDASNMRQLGIGTVAYLNDNNDTIFTNNTSVTNTSGGSSSSSLYAPGLLQINYVPNTAVFQSPFDKRTPSASPANVSYGVNANLSNRSGQAQGNGQTFDGNFANLVSASQLILYAPAFTGDPSVTAPPSWKGLDSSCVQVSAPGGGGGGGVSPTQGTHQNGKWINVLYADSHVASIKYTDFSTVTDKTGAGGINGKLEWLPLGQ